MDTAPNPRPSLPGPTTCQALNLLCEGYTVREIAHLLGDAPATIEALLGQAAKALGVPGARRIVLALTWTRLCPLIAEPEQAEPDPKGPIYALIDPVTRRRLLTRQAVAQGRDLEHLDYGDIYMPPRGTALRPRRTRWGPLPTQSRAEVGQTGITRHARWMLKDRPRRCQRCAYSQFVDVCHIRPIHTFAPDALLADVNAPGNLIYLCPNCHREFDAGLWTMPQTGTTDAPTQEATPRRMAWTSRYRGVSWQKTSQRWRADIASAGSRCRLGAFDDERDAARAYNAAARRLHGERAFLNDVD